MIEHAQTINEYYKLQEQFEPDVTETEVIETTIESSVKTVKPITDASFMTRGRCNDLPPDKMFPHEGKGVDAARKICSICVVKEECLEYALTKKIGFGVWGGTSERERRKMLKARAAKSKE